ncbi:uncharacterized protein NEMAJ01_0842 [Nematocida major]|uniref:uncharacterized protein n=1 Tax=Nematocida major TaxID=1912982 RepID=UPI0020087A2F|nr:uncharacterized protein NEMAJ01_0842 [Nematocida major]KAH9385946.1 hypothetical protein NEMAJ01_0842 [Nematocida major]
MLLGVSLRQCFNEECFNNKGETVITTEKLYMHSARKYCEKCVEDGLDYVHTDDIIFNRNGRWEGKPEVEKQDLVEESLFLKKIKKRGFTRNGAACFGVFTKKEYHPNETIGAIGGVLGNINMYRTGAATKSKSPSRCFIFRESGQIIDSRKSGNLVRFIRRSCRPNVAISIEACEEGWKARPPLKKNPFIVYPVRAKLYAISKIENTDELFIGNKYSSYAGEAWASSELGIGPDDLVDTCACTSSWRCLFEGTPFLEKTRSVNITSKISSIFVQMQKYMREKIPFPRSDMAYVLNRKCTFTQHI